MNGGAQYDYIHRAVKKNKTDIVFSISAYISAAVLYLYPVVIDGVRFVPVLQFCALVALVTGIYINQRYTWVSFFYGAAPSENKNSGEVTGAFFVVTRMQGKRRSSLAKIDLRDCEKLLFCTHKDNKKSELAEYDSPTIYNFCATMCPAEYCRAVFRADGGIAVISFEPDSTLASILREFAAKNEKET